MKGLFAKFYLLLSFPILCFLGTSFYLLTDLYAELSSDRDINESIEVIVDGSVLINSLQIERGMSAAYLSGADNYELLENQRKKVELAVSVYGNKAFKNKLIRKAGLDYSELESQLKVARVAIDKKEWTKSGALQFYSSKINSLLEFNYFLLNQSNSNEIINYLGLINLLEEAKEAGGKYRAQVASLFASNRPFVGKAIDTIIDLKSTFEGNLHSPAINHDKALSQLRDEVYKLPEWEFQKDYHE